MIQKWSRYRILRQLFDHPRKIFLIRELSRNTNLAQTSVRAHLKQLSQEKLVQKDTAGLYPGFKANITDQYKLLKQQDLVRRLFQSGLIHHLEKKIYPACVVLFGSASRGEDTENSDIDLFIQANRTPLNLKKYESELNRKIHVIYEASLKKLSPELLNNIANGVVVYGYLKLFNGEME